MKNEPSAEEMIAQKDTAVHPFSGQGKKEESAA